MLKPLYKRFNPVIRDYCITFNGFTRTNFIGTYSLGKQEMVLPVPIAGPIMRIRVYSIFLFPATLKPDNLLFIMYYAKNKQINLIKPFC